MDLGINLSFAIKRWPEPEAWARIVREDLGLKRVQFTFDLLDPWSPQPMRSLLATQVHKAASAWDIEIHSAFVGLANYSFNGLLHPDPAGRRIAMEWWRCAIDVAAEIGASAIGGPLGGMSQADAAQPAQCERQYRELLDAVAVLSQAAAAAGLKQLLVEPTPLVREVPHTVIQAQQLLADLAGRGALPIAYVIDVGHAFYQPLYGPSASADEWLSQLKQHIGLIHLQNTDFQSDSHWGWPDARGRFEVSTFARKLRAAGLDGVPIFLEVFYPFELTDDAVLSNIRSSVTHCVQQLRL